MISSVSALQIQNHIGSEFVCMYEDLSDAAPTAFEDGSLCCIINGKAEHMFYLHIISFCFISVKYTENISKNFKHTLKPYELLCIYLI